MKSWVIKIGTSILRGTEEASTEEIIENLSGSFTSFLSKGNKLIFFLGLMHCIYTLNLILSLFLRFFFLMDYYLLDIRRKVF